MKPLIAFLLLIPLATSAPAAGSRLLVSSALVDPSLAAPVVRLYVDKGNGTAYEVGLSGWTLDGEWRRQLSSSMTLVASADATPLNAHNSNRIYVNGRRESAAEFENASYRARGGVRFTFSPASSLDARLVLLREVVADVSPEVARRWNGAYTGVELAHTWSTMRVTEPLIARFDGFEVVTRGEFFTGERDWSRMSVVERFGHTSGRLHLSQSVALLQGQSLDVVNRFVVGGSWDTLGGTAIHGTRYGELRLDHGVLAGGGLDVQLPAQWTMGARVSLAAGDDARVHGLALNVTKVWRTTAVNFGLGTARHRGAGRGETIAYGVVVVPLYKSK